MHLRPYRQLFIGLLATISIGCQKPPPPPAPIRIQAPLQATQIHHLEQLPEAKWAISERTASQAPGPADTKIFIVTKIAKQRTPYWSARPESASITIPDSIASQLGVTGLASGRQNPTTRIFRGPAAQIDSFTTAAYPLGIGIVAGDLLLMEFFSR